MRKLLLLLSTITFVSQLYAQVNVVIPDLVERDLTTDDPISVMLTASDLTGLGVISYQFTITYDHNVVTATDIKTTGTISDVIGWTVLPNTGTPGVFQVAGFGTVPLSGSGDFIELIFKVANPPPGYTDFTSTEFLFNAGTPIVNVTDGSITLKNTADAPLTGTSPSYMDPGEEYWVEITVGDATLPVKDMNVLSFDFLFDNTQYIDYLGFEVGSFMSDATPIVIPDDPNGMISASLFNLAQGYSGHGVIMRFNFVVKPTTPPSPAILISNNWGAVQANRTDGSEQPLDPQIFTYLIVPVELISFDTPNQYLLYQCYPNPFNPSTKIKYALPQNSKVNLTIYNTIGEVVMILVDEIQNEGFHEVDFNASDLTNGIYFYRLVANDNAQVKKMILLK